MPVIQVTLIEGRSKELKKKLVKSLTQAAVDAIGAPIQSVRVILNEIPPEHFGAAGVTMDESS